MQFVLVRYVRVDDAWVETVRAAAARGPVCFVLRNRSLIDFLCLRGLLARLGLPELGAVTGLSGVTYLPLVSKLVRFFQKRPFEILTAEMRNALKGGGSSVVFLRRPAVRGVFGSRPTHEDGIRVLTAVQAELEAPVQALPMVFLWGESAMRRMPGAMDFLFGSNEYPRLFRSVMLLLGRRAVHKLKAASPMDLSVVRQERRCDDRALTGIVRAFVGRQIELIRRAELGALTKPSARTLVDTLSSPRLMQRLRTAAAHQHIPEKEIVPRARAILRKLAADFKPDVLSLFARVLTFVWRRVYTGIDVRPEDIERLRAAVGGGASLLLPSHKSHADYLVLSYLMRENNLMSPHIAAGQNLAFWPLGFLFRSSGAFFIRRSFGNDLFYTAVVSAYVRRLVFEGYAIEVFIEGGRSRTGKLLFPKTGILDMALQAAALAPNIPLTVLPVYIGYEHVIEEKAYVAESGGRPKKAESIKGLIHTTTVLFHRYGQVYVRTAEPFSIDEVLRAKGLCRRDLLQDATRRSVARDVGMKTLSEINAVTVVGAASILATVLLSRRALDISHAELTNTVFHLARLLQAEGAPLSDKVREWLDGDEASVKSLDRVCKAFVKSGRIQRTKQSGEPRYSLKPPQRATLEYYKNNIIHFLVPASLCAAICLSLREEFIDLSAVSTRSALALSLYRREFILSGPAGQLDDASASVSQDVLRRMLDPMIEQSIVEIEDRRIRVRDRAFAAMLADVLRDYHQVYLDAMRETMGNDGGPSSTTEMDIGRKPPSSPHSKMYRKNARAALKELRLLGPANNESPFTRSAQGGRLRALLRALSDASRSEPSREPNR